MNGRPSLVVWALLALLAVGGAPAMAQTTLPQEGWQGAADGARFTLLVPATPAGFTLVALDVNTPACNGQADAQVHAEFRRGDGAVITIDQEDGVCGQLGDTEIGPIQAGGMSGVAAQIGAGDCFAAPDAAPCVSNINNDVTFPDGRTLVFDNAGIEIVVSSNLAGTDPLVAFVNGSTWVTPTPGLGPLFERFKATVLRVQAADQLLVRENGHLRVVRLAAVVAPRGKQCWAPEAKRLAARLMPPGRSFWFQDDPRPGYSYWAFRSFSGVGGLPFLNPINGKLVAAGAVKRAPGTWRLNLANDALGVAAGKLGFWGKSCHGSFKPKVVKPKPKPVPAPVRFVSPSPAPAPSGPARSSGYNCSDFPLADGTSAQTYLNLYPDDPSGLDGDNDGSACESS